MRMTLSLVNPVLALIAAPFLPGIINRTKAFFAGRTGPPLLQAYHDIWKLLRKGVVYSSTTSWIFWAGPWIGFATVLVALTLVPFGGSPALIAFPGDFIVLIYLLGLSRFLLVLSALDTGSSFEGMGASREVTFSAMSEPALLIGLVAVARYTSSMSLSDMVMSMDPHASLVASPVVVLVGFALLIVFLSENCRIPVDDPNTHLELTMIHEVMVLDHSGPDFGIILYTASLKMWLLGQVLVAILVPVHTGVVWFDAAAALASMIVLMVLVGVIESSMARVRLLHVPQLLIGATTLSILAAVLALR